MHNVGCGIGNLQNQYVIAYHSNEKPIAFIIQIVKYTEYNMRRSTFKIIHICTYNSRKIKPQLYVITCTAIYNNKKICNKI